jgi:hypothetical protein
MIIAIGFSDFTIQRIMPGKIKQGFVDPKALATGENMWKAIEAGDYEGFVECGSAFFKA